jgi:hypothetical protein
MVTRQLGVAAAVLGTLLCPAVAQADLMYRFDQANYVVAPGETVEVRVYLTETPGTAFLTTEGLFSAGVRVSFGEPPVPSSPAQVVSLGDILPNPAFDEVVRSLGGDWAGLAQAALMNPTVFPNPGTTEILLGIFRFTAGLIPGEVTNLLATDLHPPLLTETVTGLGTALDKLIGEGRATITVDESVAMIPEPSGLVLLATATLCLAGYRRRFRGPAA